MDGDERTSSHTWLQLSVSPSASFCAKAAPASARSGPASTWLMVATMKCDTSRTNRLGCSCDLE